MFLKNLIHSAHPYRAKILCAGVIVLYQILAVSLWKGGDGLPYVMDGNENWSNAGHAKNMVDYGWEGLKKSWGLADEVAEMSGKHPEAHPVIYSHGGEFPRIWITLLYLLGVVSVSQQILITAVIIGGLAVFFAYKVFEYVLDSPVWAAVACGFMLTDYIGIMQWMVNTWRVWQIFSFYGSISYVVLLLRNPSNWRIQLLGGFMAFSLYYAEPVFAMFTGLSVAIFLLISRKVCSWPELRCLLQLKGFALGAVMAILILATQLIGYYGYTNLLKDIKTTIVARNFADRNEAEKKSPQKVELYEKNNVMFMPNYEQGKNDRKIDYSIKNLFGGGLIQFPYFCLMAALFLIATLLVNELSLREGYFNENWKCWGFVSNSSYKSYILFIFLWCFYISIFYRYGAFINWSSGGQFIRNHGRGLPGLFIGSLFLGVISAKLSNVDDRKKLCIGIVATSLFSIAVQYLKPIDSTDYTNIFQESHIVRFSYFWGCLLLPFLAMSKTTQGSTKSTKACSLFFTGLSAGIVLNFAFAGYVKTGYLNKSCPLVVFGFFPFMATIVRSYSNSYMAFNLRWRDVNWVGQIITVLLALEWVGAGATFLQLLPPHGAESIRWVGHNYPGQVIATQNYAMPYAYETKGTARYCLPGNILRENKSPPPVQLDKEKLWIRKTDLIPGYEKPSILVEYKQNHTLFGWAHNLFTLFRDEKSLVSNPVGQSKITECVYKQNKRNNHFEVFELSWDPFPYIEIVKDNSEGFFRAEYPVRTEGYARPLNSVELKNINIPDTENQRNVEVNVATLGLRISEEGQSPILLSLMPVLIKKNSDLMLGAKATYADETSKEGDTKIFLYCVNDAYKTENTKINDYPELKIEKGRDYYNLKLLSEAPNSSGIMLTSLDYGKDYVVGLQPVAKDGRKGLVYLSKSFRFTRQSLKN
ncbi:MAG: hypothetical protein ACEQSM_01815 [Aliarcobacter sp.]